MPRLIEGVDELRRLTGQEVGASDWFEMTQSRIDAFAALTADSQWIHVDRERAARESPYGGTIAHGFLTLSLLSHLLRDAVEVRGEYEARINYGLNRVRFPSPVKAGARVRGRFTVQALEELAGAVHVTWSVVIEIEGQIKPACVAEWVVRLVVKSPGRD
jgi:acyl dehydratase